MFFNSLDLKLSNYLTSLNTLASSRHGHKETNKASTDTLFNKNVQICTTGPTMCL